MTDMNADPVDLPDHPVFRNLITSFSTEPPVAFPSIIDIRPASDYAVAHVKSSTHFDGLHGPHGLVCRLSELPPPERRDNSILVCSSNHQAQQAADILRSRGFRNLLAVPFDHLVAHVPAVSIVSGVSSRPLWLPAPLLSDCLPQLLAHLPRRTALDLGAGAGRDAVYLASHGFRVVAVDRDANLLSKCDQLSARTLPSASGSSSGSVNTIVRTFGAHLAEDARFLSDNAADLLLVVRFLRRGVLEHLWRAVLPGGFVLYEHFLQGCEQFGSPAKPSQMLRHGELKSLFSPQRGFSVLRDDSLALPDGRPICRFIARRHPSP